MALETDSISWFLVLAVRSLGCANFKVDPLFLMQTEHAHCRLFSLECDYRGDNAGGNLGSFKQQNKVHV